MDRGAWETTVHGFVKSWTLLSNFTFTFMMTQKVETIMSYMVCSNHTSSSVWSSEMPHLGRLQSHPHSLPLRYWVNLGMLFIRR